MILLSSSWRPEWFNFQIRLLRGSGPGKATAWVWSVPLLGLEQSAGVRASAGAGTTTDTGLVLGHSSSQAESLRIPSRAHSPEESSGSRR